MSDSGRRRTTQLHYCSATGKPSLEELTPREALSDTETAFMLTARVSPPLAGGSLARQRGLLPLARRRNKLKQLGT